MASNWANTNFSCRIFTDSFFLVFFFTNLASLKLSFDLRAVRLLFRRYFNEPLVFPMRAQSAARGGIFEWPFAFRFDRMKAFDVNRKNGRGRGELNYEKEGVSRIRDKFEGREDQRSKVKGTIDRV